MHRVLQAALGKVLLPALISAAIFTVFYLGGDGYQTFGLAAVDSTRKALKYVLGVAAFLSLAVLAQRVIRYVVFDGIILSATGTPVPKLLSQLSGLVIFVVAVSACAGIVFDQDLTVLWAASGVAGLVLGMALRELLQDVFAGIALNIDRAVRIGDFIQLHKAGDAGISGQLLEISWRTTRIKDFSGDVVIVPNSRFSAFTITNFSQPEPASYRSVTVTLDARVPPDRALRILQAAALEAVTGLLGAAATVTPPSAEVKAIKPDGVEYAVYFKTEWRFLASARPLILSSVLSHLSQAGLEPAVPRQDTRDGAGFMTPDRDRLVTLIGATALFRGLGRDALEQLATDARLRVEPPDRVVAQAGEVGESLFLVLEGLLSAEAGRRGGARPTLPPMLRPGDLFDPTVVLLGEAHGCTVRTRTSVLLCEIGSDTLAALFQADAATLPTIGRALAGLRGGPSARNGGPNGAEDWNDHVLRQMRFLFPVAVSKISTV